MAAQGESPVDGVIYNFAGWVGAVAAFFLILEKWHLVERQLQDYLAMHLGYEYLELWMLGAVIAAWFGAFSGIQLLLYVVGRRIYYAVFGS